jgi:membrane protein implicated in regulation of membrane protease activity
MKILRTGGEYLAWQRRRYLGTLLVVAGAGTVAGVLASVIWGPLAGSAAVLAAVVLARQVHRGLRSYARGQKGEASVTEVLQGLPEGYFLVNDLLLPGGSGNVDHVLVGPSGVVVLESKRYWGRIRCRGSRWFANGRPIKSPALQAIKAAVAVRRFLEGAAAEGAGADPGWVSAVVVFTHPCCRLRLDRADPAVTVIRLSQLRGLVAGLPRRPGFTPARAVRVAELLAMAGPAAGPAMLVPAAVGEPAPASR